MKPSVYVVVAAAAALLAGGLIAIRSFHKNAQKQDVVTLPHDGPYSIFRGETEGHTFFATINTGVRNLPADDRLPFFLSISVPLNKPTSDGLTAREEANVLNDWEDALTTQLSSQVKLLYVGRVTWNDHRDIIYYVDSQQAVSNLLNSLKRDPSSRPFTFICKRDDNWEKAAFWLDRP